MTEAYSDAPPKNRTKRGNSVGMRTDKGRIIV